MPEDTGKPRSSGRGAVTRTIPEIAVVAAIKAFAYSLNMPIDYVPDTDVLGVVKELIRQAPSTFPGKVDYGPSPGPTDRPKQ